MKFLLLALGLACSMLTSSAVIPPGTADEKTGEGWQAVGFPVDDYVPWNLQIQAKEITFQDRKYLVVAGYLVASPTSIVLFPDEAASRSGRTDGALVLSRDDSPAMRWLFGRFGNEHAEGLYAVGGVLAVTPTGPQLGHLTKIRFAMKGAAILPPEENAPTKP